MRLSLRARVAAFMSVVAAAAAALTWYYAGTVAGLALAAAIAAILIWIGSGLATARHLREIDALAQLTGKVASSQLPSGTPEVGDPALRRLIAALQDAYDSLVNQSGRSAEVMAETQSVLDDLSDAVMTVDATGRITRVNPAAGVFFGWIPHEAMIGKTLLEATLNHHLSEMVGRTLSQGEAVDETIRLGNPGHRTLSVTTIPSHLSDGAARAAVLVARDITQAELLAAKQRDFVANASHELRSPIAGIGAMASALVAGGLDDPETRRQFALSIQDSTHRLTALVDDLLFLGVHDSVGEPELQVCDLAKVAKAASGKYGAQAEAHGIELRSEFGEQLWVLGEEQSLWRAVSNLVDNALRYTDRGGSVNVSGRVTDEMCIVEVRDTGIGIPTQDQQRIFERFYRVDVARSRKTGGTGLGLSIVRSIVERYGGSAQVESQVGRGSCFSISLPQHAPPPGE